MLVTLFLAAQVLSCASEASPADSVSWLPMTFDGVYAKPNGRPTWSPDDLRVAVSYFDYWPPQYFHTNLHVQQQDGSWLQCPLENLTWGGAAWSPAGNVILASNGSRLSLFLPDECGTGEIPGVGGADPQWSRDGQRIVFSENIYPGAAMWTVSPSGEELQRLVDDGQQPDWSPDGQTIVFVRAQNLWTISSDGTNERQLTDSGHDQWPAWSPDGTRIAFTRQEGDWIEAGVWIISAQGGAASLITPIVEGQRRSRPCWSHDGKRLTYFVMEPQTHRIGIGILCGEIPLAVQRRSWSALKQSYR